MKLGMVFYRHQATEEYLRYARQLGCTHVVLHLTDYFHKENAAQGTDNQPVGDRDGWGVTRNRTVWTTDELLAIKKTVEAAGLVWEAIENFDPGFWYDVLLDGPERDAQMEGLKTLIRNMGEAGIPVMGYNFSLAGVAGRTTGPQGRGGAETVIIDGRTDEPPIPRGMVWNMIYDPENFGKGVLPPTTSEQLWDRFARFLKEIVPVAERAGVAMALHPDDPPFDTVRGTPRLVYRIPLYQKVLDIVPSASNGIECCVGTLGEMEGGDDLYAWLAKYAAEGAIKYVHLRNIRGKVPHFVETFLDEGDIDVLRVVRVLADNGFDGVVIPDHSPLVSCDTPWLTGMAYALGYIRASMQAVERGCTIPDARGM